MNPVGRPPHRHHAARRLPRHEPPVHRGPRPLHRPRPGRRQVEVIEVTHGDGLGGSSFNYGFSKTPELDLIKAAVDEARPRRSPCSCSGPGHHPRPEPGPRRRRLGGPIATHCTEADVSIQHFRHARKLGMETVGFLMLSHRVHPGEARRSRPASWPTPAASASTSSTPPAPDPRGCLRPRLRPGRRTRRRRPGRLPRPPEPELRRRQLGVRRARGRQQIDGALMALGAGAGNSPGEVLAAAFDRLNIKTGVDVQGVMGAAEDVVKPFTTRSRSWTAPPSCRSPWVFLLPDPRRTRRRTLRRPGLPDPEEIGKAGYVGGQEDVVPWTSHCSWPTPAKAKP